jgi:hyperosmotically inducible protein
MKTFEVRKSLFRSTLIAAALAAGMGATGPVLADTGDTTESQPQSDGADTAAGDTAITAELQAKFLGEARLKTAHISVRTFTGMVTLTGTVVDAESKFVALELARSVEGVKSVDGYDLSVPSAAMTASPAAHPVATATRKANSDSVITTKVRSEILADNLCKGSEVSVSTRRGVVTLSGKLARPDAIYHVKDIAEKVAGVKSVNTSGLTSSGG